MLITLSLLEVVQQVMKSGNRMELPFTIPMEMWVLEAVALSQVWI